MKVTTLRLPEPLYDDIVDEASQQDLSFSEYARMLLRNRKQNTNTQEHTQPNTDRIHGRLDDLEDRVAELEGRATTAERLNQQNDADTPSLVKDDVPGAVDLDDNPHSQTIKTALQWAREHEPVRRAELREAFEDSVDIKWESLWERHLRDALKADGFEYDRSSGVAVWSR